MIRVVSAWALIVLAASPVTAPFASCDLGDLLTPVASAQLIVGVAPVSQALTIYDSGNSACALIHREPTAESRAGDAILPFCGVSTGICGVDRTQQIRHSPRDRSIRLTVLRV